MFDIQKLASSPVVQIIAVIALILSAVFIGYATMKKESLEDVPADDEIAKADLSAEPIVTIEQPYVPEEVAAVEDKEFAPSSLPENGGEISPEDLLPKTSDVKAFEAQFPQGQGDVTDKNFLVAGYNIGINTVSSSLKNANLQLRSDPYIPRQDTGPWNQSTILSSDLSNRQSLQIGSSC